MPPRRRPTAEFEATQSESGPRIITIDSPVGGYQGYTSPDLLSPKFWQASSQVYAGQFGVVRRARWAPFLNSTVSGFTAHAQRIVSMFSFLDPSVGIPINRVLFDNNDDVTWPLWICNNPLSTTEMFPSALVNPQPDIWELGFAPQFNFPFPVANLNGPWMRNRIGISVYMTNGLFRGKIAAASHVAPAPVLMLWGLDAPDVSPTITLSAGLTATISAAPTGAVRALNVATITTTAPHGLSSGQYVAISGVTDTTFNSLAGQAFLITVTGASTFTYANIGTATTSGSGTVTLGITKTVGRSYQWAWASDFDAELSAPSPASQFVKYNNQVGTIDLVETGTVTVANGSTTVTGVGTNFTSAWIGRAIWVEGSVSTRSYIASVSSATSMLLNANYNGTSIGGARFQIYDPRLPFTNSGFVKLYATGDGGSVYFLVGRNAFNPGGSTALAAGLEFSDTANSEPPNPPFSSEITQIYNVPPPIGSFLQDYQGRILLYGVPAALQTFFYSNIEATVVGQPPDCFGTLNTVTLPLGDGNLNGMANLPTGLLIWSNRQDMFKLTGLLTDNTVANATQLGATIQRLPYKIGSASPYATAVTSLGAIWLSSDREVWLFTDHYAPKNIGKPVQDVLNRINGSRLAFAKMTYYKRGERSWLALAIAVDSSTFNNKLLLLDLDLLASNGQPSFFTFDLATNAPTWYQYDINCEGICTAYDNNSVNHLLVGDVDLITDVDWQPGFFTVSAEQNVPGANIRLHAFGNEDPHMVKTFQWMRALTNQIPSTLAGAFAGHGSYLTLQDSGGHNWDVYVTDAGVLQTIGGSISTPGTFLINDPSNTASWQLGVSTLGLLTTTAIAFNAGYPKTLTIASITGNSAWAIGVTLAGLLTTAQNVSNWSFSVNAFDDDAFIIGVNPQVTNLIPGISNPSNTVPLEYSPALFKFGGAIPIKGRRFQIGAVFPSIAGLFELRGYEVSYNSTVGR